MSAAEVCEVCRRHPWDGHKLDCPKRLALSTPPANDVREALEGHLREAVRMGIGWPKADFLDRWIAERLDTILAEVRPHGTVTEAEVEAAALVIRENDDSSYGVAGGPLELAPPSSSSRARSCKGGPPVTVIPVREATDAGTDAAMLADIRTWRANRHPASGDQVTLGLEEVDMLLRVADERDTLRREVCEEPSPPDAKYVVRTCPDCHHEPHGIRMLCINRFCACRNEGPTR